MSAKAYLKENSIYLFYDPKDIGGRSGCIYDLGYHLLNFLWFDMDSLSDVYSRIIMLHTNPEYLKKEKYKEYTDILFEQIELIDSFCPYLHFYTQELLAFIFDFPNDNEKALYRISGRYEAASVLFEDMLDAFIAEDEADFEVDGDELTNLMVKENPPRSYVISTNMPLEELKHVFFTAKEAIIQEIGKKREQIKKEIDFITNFKESRDIDRLTPMQRLYIFDCMRMLDGAKAFYTDSHFTTEFVPLKRITDDISTPEQMSEFILRNKVDVVEMYDIDSIDTLIRFELLKMISASLIVKRCKHCGHYFIPKGRVDSEYCDRTIKGEIKPCNIIGSIKQYKNKVAENPVHEAFGKAYKRNNSRVRNRRMTQQEFFSWSENARRLRDDCLESKITLEEFQKWLDAGK